MASIKGFQLKNVKQTKGIEGYGCTASMYLNGKKIGTYADYGDGGMEDVTFVSKEAEENMIKTIIEFAKTYSNEFIIALYKERPEQFADVCRRFKKAYPYIPDEDITIQTMASNSIVWIVNEFLKLYEVEKVYKRYVKKGYRAVCAYGTDIAAYPASWSDEKILEEANGHKVYMSLDDFNV